ASAGPRIRLPDDPRSPEFWQALREAQGKSNVERTDLVAPAIDAFLESCSVSEDTLSYYRRSLNPAKKAWGQLPVAGIRPAHVDAMMKSLKATKSKANSFLSLMRMFSGWCQVKELTTQSMVEGVKSYKLTGGHKPWTKEQLAAADKHLTGVVRQGYFLYRYTGQRGSDVVR